MFSNTTKCLVVVYSYIIKWLCRYGYYTFFLLNAKGMKWNAKGLDMCQLCTIRASWTNRAFESDLFNESVDLETVAVMLSPWMSLVGLTSILYFRKHYFDVKSKRYRRVTISDKATRYENLLPLFHTKWFNVTRIHSGDAYTLFIFLYSRKHVALKLTTQRFTRVAI